MTNGTITKELGSENQKTAGKYAKTQYEYHSYKTNFTITGCIQWCNVVFDVVFDTVFTADPKSIKRTRRSCTLNRHSADMFASLLRPQ